MESKAGERESYEDDSEGKIGGRGVWFALVVGTASGALLYFIIASVYPMLISLRTYFHRNGKSFAGVFYDACYCGRYHTMYEVRLLYDNPLVVRLDMHKEPCSQVRRYQGIVIPLRDLDPPQSTLRQAVANMAAVRCCNV